MDALPELSNAHSPEALRKEILILGSSETIVCLAGLGVCVEEEIDSASLLLCTLSDLICKTRNLSGKGAAEEIAYSGGQGHATRNEVARGRLVGRHHAKFATL